MKSIEETYPDRFDSFGFFDGVCDYNPLLESFGFTILVQVDERDYSGDTFVLYLDSRRLGILNFGWGSCSGCDALQACNSYERLEDLRNSLFNQIRWFEDIDSLIDYIDNFDHNGQWYGSEEVWSKFKDECNELLSKRNEDYSILLTSPDYSLREFGSYLMRKI